MRRSGFTLMELVLVMTLIVIAAGISIPVVDSLLNPNQLSAAQDTVRGHLEQTRNRAMEEGRPYRFSIQENGRDFKIEPDDLATNTDQGFVVQGELPEMCMFVPDEGGIVDPTSKPSATGNASKMIAVFLPDGTARDDAMVSFGRPGLTRITLKVRALTGHVTQLKGKST